jgi:hypothetical protein
MTTDLAIVNREASIVPAQQPSFIGTSLSILTMSEEQVTRIKLLAQMYESSTFNKTRNPLSQGDYFLIMLKGLEMGINPMAAVDLISIIQGTPVLDAKGILALVKSKGLLEDISMDGDETQYICIMKRKGESTPHKEIFTIEDAKRLGLAGKDNYIKQPRTMLKWRAVTACARVVFPDVTGGLYTAEEIDPDNVTVSDDGTMKANRHETTVPSTPASSKKKQQSESSENGDGGKVAPKWYEVEDGKNLMQILVWARKAGMTKELNDTKASDALLVLAKTSDWNNFESGKAAWAKLTAEHNAQLAELNNSDADKSQADEAAKDDELDDSKDAMGLSSEHREKVETWLKDNFNKTLREAINELEDDLSRFTHSDKVRTFISGEAKRQGWTVIGTDCTYNSKGRFLEFHTVVGNMRFYSREEFAKLVGPEYASANKIADLPANELLKLPPLVLTWEDKENYTLITGAKDLYEIPY